MCTLILLHLSLVFHRLAADIVNLPQEVLNSPMGGMLRPLLEQMTTQVRLGTTLLLLHTECVVFLVFHRRMWLYWHEAYELSC